jgi:hypothetical protein
MAVLALALYAAYLALAFDLRTLIQVRRTGSTGFHGLGGHPGSAEWIAGVGFTVALLLGATAPLLALLEVVEPIAALDTPALHIGGFALAIAGIAATFYAQVAMGTSWRNEPAGGGAPDSRLAAVHREPSGASQRSSSRLGKAIALHSSAVGVRRLIWTLQQGEPWSYFSPS